MKFLSVAILALLVIQQSFGAVIVHVPPEPILTIPGFSGSRLYDVNFDGQDDFVFGGLQVLGTTLGTIGSNRYLAIPASFPDLGGRPVALREGSILGPNVPNSLAWLNTDPLDGFVSEDEIGTRNTTLTRCLNTGCTGTFYTDFIQGQLNAFLGFEFQSEEGTHYGYFDLTFNPLSTAGFVNGWAYESDPNTPIETVSIIPEPRTLGMLLWLSVFLFKKKRT